MLPHSLLIPPASSPWSGDIEPAKADIRIHSSLEFLTGDEELAHDGARVLLLQWSHVPDHRGTLHDVRSTQSTVLPLQHTLEVDQVQGDIVIRLGDPPGLLTMLIHPEKTKQRFVGQGVIGIKNSGLVWKMLQALKCYRESLPEQYHHI